MVSRTDLQFHLLLQYRVELAEISIVRKQRLRTSRIVPSLLNSKFESVTAKLRTEVIFAVPAHGRFDSRIKPFLSFAGEDPVRVEQVLRCIVPKRKERNGTEKNSKRTRLLLGMMSLGSNGMFAGVASFRRRTRFAERGWFSRPFLVDKAHCLLRTSDIVVILSQVLRVEGPRNVL
jgi:hypothetical protein